MSDTAVKTVNRKNKNQRTPIAPTRDRSPPINLASQGTSRGSSRERNDSQKHAKGVRNFEEYKKAKNGPPVSELQITADWKDKDGGYQASSRSLSSKSPKGAVVESDIRQWGRSPQIIAQQARSQLVSRRKARPKPDKSLAEAGTKHRRLHVVQKELVTNITTDNEQEMNKLEMMGHLFTQDRRVAAQQTGAEIGEAKATPDDLPDLDEICEQGNMKPEPITSEEIHNLYEKNQAHTLHKKFQTPSAYLKKVTKQIPLDDLYEVLDYIYIGEDQEICPVLLEIKDQDLLKQENTSPQDDKKDVVEEPEDNDDERTKVPSLAMHKLKQNGKQENDVLEAHVDADTPENNIDAEETKGPEELPESGNKLKYLLQVWRRSDGQMLYERKLSKMLKGWGVTGDKFFYQEDDTEDDIFEIYMLETQGGSVKIHKIILPISVLHVQSDDPTIARKVNARVELDEQKQTQFLTKIHHALDDSDFEEKDPYMNDLNNESRKYLKSHDDRAIPYNDDDMTKLGKKDFRMPPIGFKNALNDQSETIKQQLSNSVKINIALVEGRIIMATKYNLIELKINKILTIDGEVPEQDSEESDEPAEQRDAKVIFADDKEKLIIHLQNRHIKKVAIYSDYVFQRFIDIGCDRTAMIMENEQTNQIRFILLTTKCSSNRISKLQYQLRLKTACGTSKGELKAKKKICFKVLGMTQKVPLTEVYGISPILKICSATFKLSKEDSSDCKATDNTKHQEELAIRIAKKQGLNTSQTSMMGMTRIVSTKHLIINENVEGESEEDGSDEKKAAPSSAIFNETEGHTPAGPPNNAQKVKSDAAQNNKIDKELKPVQEAIQKINEKKTGKFSTVSLILRENGKVEVYSDFELAETFNLAFNNKHLFCIDIVSDDYNFYFKFLDLNKTVSNHNKPQYVVRAVQQAWRRRITYKNTVTVTEDWDSLRLKNLNHFMRLYSQWETFMGHFLVAHRGYISVYNLKDATDEAAGAASALYTPTPGGPAVEENAPAKKGLWVQNLKIDPHHHFVRELFLIKKESNFYEFETSHMRCHSKPVMNLENLYVFGVLTGRNCIRKLHLRDGRLSEIKDEAEHQRAAEIEKLLAGKIVIEHQVDSKYATGTLIKVICGECNNDGQIGENEQYKDWNEKKKTTAYKYQSLYSGEMHDIQGVNNSHNDHLVFDNAVARAIDRCKNSKCFQLYNISFEEMTLIYERKPNEHEGIDIDCQLSVVRTSRQWWSDTIQHADDSQCPVAKYIQEINHGEDSFMQALLIYKKNEYVKVVPYLAKQVKLLHRLSAEIKVPANVNKSHDPNSINKVTVEIDQVVIRHTLHLDHAYKLLDEVKTRSVLGEQNLILFRFIQKSLSSDDMRENSFIILTSSQLSCFSQEANEVARMTGLDISSAQLQDHQYLYVMQSTVNPIYQQFASIDDNWILQPKQEVQRPERVEGFMRINFESFFMKKYSELNICQAALGQNSQIRRNYTTDAISMMQSVHKISITPVPHYNIMGFTGMHSKNNYLIWKQSSDGFFTALDKNGNLNTWSCVTGDLLWSEPQTDDMDFGQANIAGYEVYRSDLQDETYTGNFYDYNNGVEPSSSHSLSLLVSRQPVHKEKTLSYIEECQNQQCCGEIESFGDARQDTALKKKRKIADLYHKKLRQAILDYTGCSTDGLGDQNELPAEMFQSEEMQYQNRPGKKRALTKKLRRQKLYHFQVIKLRQYEDELRSLLEKPHAKKKNLKPNGSSCVLLYHFFHRLMDKFAPIEGFESYDWFLSEANLKQRLYLSKDANRMLEVIQNRIAIVWRKSEDAQDGSLITWTKAFDIPKFPFLAAEVSSLPYFLSNDFEVLVMYDYKESRIRLNHARDGSSIGQLPLEAIHKSESNDERRNTREAYSCVAIEGNDKVVTYNKVTGFLTEWPIEQKPRIEKDAEYYDEFSYKLNKKKAHSFRMENYEKNMNMQGYNYIKQPMHSLSKVATVERLMQHAMQYQLQMKRRENEGKDVDTKFHMNYCMKQQLALDFTQPMHDPMSTFQIDKTFSWLDWRIGETMLLNEKENFDSLQSEDQLRMCLNIFPCGSSFMEMIVKVEQGDTTASLDRQQREGMKHESDSSSHLIKMFSLARNGFSFVINGKRECINLEIPMFTNSFGLRPLDYACGLFSHVQQSSSDNDKSMNHRFWPLKEADKNMVKQSKNLPMVQWLFSGLKDYSFFHSSPRMVQPIIFAVKNEIVQVFDFLDARLLKNDHLDALNTECLPENMQQTASFGEYGVTVTDQLTYPKEAQNKLFKPDQTKKDSKKHMSSEEAKDKQKKQLYDYFWFDVPEIFYSSKEGYEMMTALQLSENIQIFAHVSVQIIIQNHWNYWRKRNAYLITLPVFLLVAVFSIQSCVLMPNINSVDDRVLTAFYLANLILAAYFFIMNMIGWIGIVCGAQTPARFRWEELLSVTSSCLIIFCQILAYRSFESDGQLSRWYWELLSWTAFVLWVYVLLMLRSFESISSVIRMVFMSLEASLPYLFVLVLGVLCFANAFQSIRQELYVQTENLGKLDKILPPFDKNLEVETFWDWKDKWLGEYISLWKEIFVGAVIGLDLEQSQGYSDTQMLLFFACVVFNTIVLFNLLLAVVGKVQNSVADKSDNFYYRQLVDQICTLQRVFFCPKRDKRLEVLLLARARGESATAEQNDEFDQSDEQMQMLEERIKCISRQLTDTSKLITETKAAQNNNQREPQDNFIKVGMDRAINMIGQQSK